MFVEVLLPLPIYSTFTYSVPEEFEENIKVGSRVLIQFGKKKFYTGLVEFTHSIKPQNYDVKPILSILDPEPIVRYPQIKFWNWIADYYLCTPGEVYKAAVPTGLKPESETFISLNPDYEPDEKNPFRIDERQAKIIQLIQQNKRLKISEIENETKIKNVAKILNPLLQHDILNVDEKLVERYKPKKKIFVELTFNRGETDNLHKSFEKVSRSQLQEKALIAYLDKSGWLGKDTLKEVEKSSLLNMEGMSHNILKALVDKNIFRLVKKSINRFAFEAHDLSSIAELSILSDSQALALDELNMGFKRHDIQLLHGVTGSGKTEIYTHLINHVLKEGNQVLFLVPEISLTTQLSDRLRRVFGDKLIVYHSKFSDSERVDIWKRLLSSNGPSVILGARSSIFLPFSRLGLIIVDEEHESSFKQYDPAPRYNARDAALMLAKMHGAKALLGSATPSIETYFKATEGKYGLVSLTERYKGAVLPDVEIIDMKKLRKNKEVDGILSNPLRKRIIDTYKNNKQTILFQNRRGFAPVVVCEQCGWTPKCRNCDVSLVYHKKINFLRCHYCGYSISLPPLCPACGLNGLKIFGYGTERIAEDLQIVFPEYKIVRMDLDTTRNKDAYQEIIENFADHNTDILVGTQMVSKGLDFDDVLTVGVLNADTLLNYPDFRSNERAFNMLEQVAGRAGRRQDKGKVVIQTLNPSNQILSFVAKHDYNTYYISELEERRKFSYPPFCKIINIYVKNKNPEICDKGAITYTLALKNVFGERVFGPEKPFISRIATYYLQQIMLKIETGVSMKKVKDLLRRIYANIANFPEIKSSIIYYDVDPA